MLEQLRDDARAIARAQVNELTMVTAILQGTTPTIDHMGFTFSSLQSEANFWYNIACAQVPKGCWLQPNNTARDKSACATCDMCHKKG